MQSNSLSQGGGLSDIDFNQYVHDTRSDAISLMNFHALQPVPMHVMIKDSHPENSEVYYAVSVNYLHVTQTIVIKGFCIYSVESPAENNTRRPTQIISFST